MKPTELEKAAPDPFVTIVTRIIIAVVICALAGIGAWVWTRNKAFSEGYEETVLPGQQGTYWVRKGVE